MAPLDATQDYGHQNSQPAALEGLAREVVFSVQPLFQAKGVKLELLIAPQQTFVKASRMELVQALIELASQALKSAMPSQKVCFCLAHQGNEILVDIRITGEPNGASYESLSVARQILAPFGAQAGQERWLEGPHFWLSLPFLSSSFGPVEAAPA
ncbi:MAG: HAMP domain-containing histidine kinase [Elusimicrobia bacterium]|nr:HAMP domain-containing histidine kinase [Elusimicrobiota bacterium]